MAKEAEYVRDADTIEFEEFAKYRAELRAKHNIKTEGEDLVKDAELLKDPKATEMEHRYFLVPFHEQLVVDFITWQARDDETLVLSAVDAGLRAEIRPFFCADPKTKDFLKKWVIWVFSYNV
ncbi:MAG: hypothetical protein Q9192_006560 [Flavoplaca navasiana]